MRAEQGTLYLPPGCDCAHVAPSLAERADAWMHSPGGRHVMRDLYALAANLVPRWRRTGIPVSVAKIWEDERQKIKEVTARASRMGFKIKDEYGYTLNNSYRAYVARHMMDRRGDWNGMFEVRELKINMIERTTHE